MEDRALAVPEEFRGKILLKFGYLAEMSTAWPKCRLPGRTLTSNVADLVAEVSETPPSGCRMPLFDRLDSDL